MIDHYALIMGTKVRLKLLLQALGTSGQTLSPSLGMPLFGSSKNLIQKPPNYHFPTLI